MADIEKTSRGDGTNNFFETDLTPDGQKVTLALIVDGSGTWMEFDPDQCDLLIAKLIEQRAKLPR